MDVRPVEVAGAIKKCPFHHVSVSHARFIALGEANNVLEGKFLSQSSNVTRTMQLRP